MRVSGESSDPDFVGADAAGRYKVTVDGFPVYKVLSADDIRNEVVAYDCDAQGGILLNEARTAPLLRTLFGVVRIIDTWEK